MMIGTNAPKPARRAAFSSCAMVLCGLLAVPAWAASTPDRILSTDVVGTAFRITLASGRVLQGKELTGATLSLILPGETMPQRLRLDEIVTDDADPAGEVLLHQVSILDGTGGRAELCEQDPQGQRWMFPLSGQWDSEGNFISSAGFTLTCSGGAQGKCVRFGYKPWKILPDGTDLAAYHQACVKLVRADYCGDRATTRNGMKIDLYDRIGIQRRAPNAGSDDLSFEAAWSPQGALCVAHTRVPEKMSLDDLRQSCRRLADKLGDDACTEEGTPSSPLGPALLFNRSR